MLQSTVLYPREIPPWPASLEMQAHHTLVCKAEFIICDLLTSVHFENPMVIFTGGRVNLKAKANGGLPSKCGGNLMADE